MYSCAESKIGANVRREVMMRKGLARQKEGRLLSGRICDAAINSDADEKCISCITSVHVARESK